MMNFDLNSIKLNIFDEENKIDLQKLKDFILKDEKRACIYK